MMMLIIFLITDISMVGIFAGVYGNIAKYREGMLMGVHIPKSELEHPDVKELLQLYKKRNRQFYLWNMLAGIAVCLLCFTYFSIFITVWTLWFVEFCLLTILRVYHYHQKVMEESCFSAQFLSRQLTWVSAIYSPICQTKFTVKIHRSTCRSMHWKSVYTPYSFLSPTFAIPAPISGSSGILHPATGLAELEWASTFSSN